MWVVVEALDSEKEELSRRSCCRELSSGEREGDEEAEVKEVKGLVDVAERCSSCGVGWPRDVEEAAESPRISGEGEGSMEEAEVLMRGCVWLCEVERAVGAACDELRGRTESGVRGKV